MQHYHWYAMVNHCLALVVIIHKTAERNEMRTHKTREREREREIIEGKTYFSYKTELGKFRRSCGYPSYPRNDP